MTELVFRSDPYLTAFEMEKLVKEELEAHVNALSEAAHATSSYWITDAELDARPELVKTMSVAPPRGEGRVRLLEIPGVNKRVTLVLS